MKATALKHQISKFYSHILSTEASYHFYSQETKTRDMFACSPRPPTLSLATWICTCGHTRDVVIYSRFHQNPSRGFGATGGRNLPFSIALAIGFYNSMYYRSSAVTHITQYFRTTQISFFLNFFSYQSCYADTTRHSHWDDTLSEVCQLSTRDETDTHRTVAVYIE